MIRKVGVSLLCALALGLGACASDNAAGGGAARTTNDPATRVGQGNYNQGGGGGDLEVAAKPKPAPAKPAPAKAEPKPVEVKPAAPAAKPAAPAAKPAPAQPAARPANSNVASLAYPTGDERTSALLISQHMPREVRKGVPYTYEIHVKNLTNGTLQNVAVNSSNFQNFDMSNADPAGVRGGDGITWNVGDLGAGETKVIKLTGVAGQAGVMSGSCLSASYANILCAQTPVVEPALAIVKTVTPQDITTCETVTITYKVTNPGSGVAENVRVQDNLDCMTVDGRNSIDRAIGTLASGQSQTFTVTGKPSKIGQCCSPATAMADGGLTARSEAPCVTVHQPALAIKAECPGNILIGREATVKFTVTASGDTDTQNVVVTHPQPQGWTFSKADNNGAAAGGKVTWNLGTLRRGESRTVSATYRAMSAGTITAAATATGTCAAAVTDQCQTGVQGVPDIGTGIEDDDGVELVGDPHTFRFVVKNQGQIPLTGVKVVCTFTDGLEYVSTDFRGPAPSVAGKVVTFNVGNLAVGQTISFSFVGRGTAEGEQAVESVTGSNELKRTVRNDEQVTYVPR